MSDIDLPVGSWNRFLTRHLLIEPNLVGAAHEFTYENCKVRIQIPPEKHLSTEPLEGELLSFNAWKDVDTKKIPVDVWVHAVDVVGFASKQIRVPEAILNQSPNAYDILPKTQQEQLDTAAKDYTSLVERAFDLWLRILRWKCNNSAFGRPEIIDHKSGWSTYLITETTHQRVWHWNESEKVTIILDGRGAVTIKQWDEAQSALQSGMYPPIFVDLMFDAIEHMKLGDLHRATVDMAVACESYLRTLVSNSLPAGVNDSVREYVDDANIRAVLSKFVPDILSQEERKQLKKIENILHKLFNARNDIVHTGQVERLKPEDCEAFLDATRKLLAFRNHDLLQRASRSWSAELPRNTKWREFKPKANRSGRASQKWHWTGRSVDEVLPPAFKMR